MRKPLGDEERVQMRGEVAGRYARGQTLRAIVAETGMSYGTVHRLLAEAGMTMRPTGPRTAKAASRG